MLQKQKNEKCYLLLNWRMPVDYRRSGGSWMNVAAAPYKLIFDNRIQSRMIRSALFVAEQGREG